ncbi:Zn-dependent exopeptidase [Mycena rosella]|uniref:Zn-dependent exopeptidase n=1 Tax=Mycena rosella TaxID=1033263 RepID=A0AAD7CMF5_MYCRO|nr:Zn-dependent exopeptidase [Mycena rosella]
MSEKKSPSGTHPPIPLPVTDSAVAAPQSTRLRKLFGLTLILVNVLVFHTFFLAPAARWYKNSRGDFQGLSTHPHGKRHFIWGKEAEKLFLSVPNAESAIAASRQFATKPHLAGSEGDLQTAKDFLTLLQTELGIESGSTEPFLEAGSPASRDATNSIPKTHKPKAWIDVYYPVMNTPLNRTLAVKSADGEIVWEAELEEVADDTDPEAGKYYDAVPTFHGLSAAGDVQGKLVYANYGRKEDYDDLVEKGVNLTGTIVICRYGGIFRGLKVKGAQDLGAAGVLIYSDLRDDGPVTEANGYLPYPQGPARNVNSVQRGSVQFLSVYPGDPTTPGYPAYENSTRTDGDNIPKIPSLPISAANAEKLFKLVAEAEEGAEVHLVNNVDTKVTPIWNTMAVIPGFITDEVVVIGNHRDAWVMGATDPSSGTVSVHEAVRGFGALMKKGWKPLRTILIASWDAEEYGLIGSTESDRWVEDFPEFIDKHVVTYLNLDSSVGGSRFSSSASPSLSHFLREAALDIPHPTESGRTLWDARNDVGPYGGEIVDAESVAVSQSVHAMTDSVGVSPLGSGSDYTAFLQMIGVASSDAGFGGSGQDAVYHYHSVFDSEHWQENYADPGFHRHVAVAKHIGLEILRLSSAVVLPLNTTHYTYELENYLNGIESIALDSSVDVDLAPLRKSIVALQAASHSLDFEKASAEKDLRKMIHKWAKRQSRLKKKLRRAYCRLKKALGHPCHGHEGFTPGHGCAIGKPAHSGPASKLRVGRLPAFLDEQQGLGHEVLYGLAMHSGFGEDALGAAPPRFPLARLKKAVRRIRAVNQKLVGFEKGFISKDGIPDREWYKHLAIAPGKWLGYGATPLPALSEAIQYEKNATLAQYEVGRLTDLIDKLADQIRVHA